VTSGSPAEKAGLKAGDLITALDGEPVTELNKFSEAIRHHKAGDEITLSVYRSGETGVKEVKATLAENPEKAGETYLGIQMGMVNIHRETETKPMEPEVYFIPQPENRPNLNPLLSA